MSEEKASIDRIEEGQAVLLVGDPPRELIVPVAQLPAGAGGGDWLRVEIDGDRLVRAALDAAETGQARARVRSKMDLLRKRGRAAGKDR